MEAAVAGNRVMSFRKLWKGLAALGKTERKRDSLVVSSGSRNQQLAQSQGWNDPADPVSSGCYTHTPAHRDLLQLPGLIQVLEFSSRPRQGLS